MPSTINSIDIYSFTAPANPGTTVLNFTARHLRRVARPPASRPSRSK